MTNQQFTEYLEQRLDAIRAMADKPADYENQERLLIQAHKIMTHASGPARRRFRRDYERRLAFKQEMKQEIERLKLINGLVNQQIKDE